MNGFFDNFFILLINSSTLKNQLKCYSASYPNFYLINQEKILKENKKTRQKKPPKNPEISMN